MAEKDWAPYKCWSCQKLLTAKDIEKRIICPYCSSRIVVKTRPPVLKKVKAR